MSWHLISAAVNIVVQISFQIVVFQIYAQEWNAESYYSIFSFLRNLHTVLHSD